ncbi:MAG: aminoglycoside phosphotransferase family protein [Deltaproteobacteria bacterium]|nr:aminoglycoside phosphotransferase family protein [Deltaproteobacteria bacterium]
MDHPSGRRVAELAGARAATRGERIASVWGGYGELVRYQLTGGPLPSVVVKRVQPGRGGGLSHQRKLHSYQVEQRWYADYAPQIAGCCRGAACLAVERDEGGWLFVLEDLDAAGFPVRIQQPKGRQLDAVLRWLAAFHARLLGQRPRGLWRSGTYWHLQTRSEELQRMGRGPLREAAEAIDRRLASARFQTLVHGDAKPANFCWRADGGEVAAVDFQYVGKGVGVKDVAYLLAGEDRATAEAGVERYLQALGRAAPPEVAEALVAEWRALYPWAWADFQRFLAGWAPNWRLQPHERALTEGVLRAVWE